MSYEGIRIRRNILPALRSVYVLVRGMTAGFATVLLPLTLATAAGPLLFDDGGTASGIVCGLVGLALGVVVIWLNVRYLRRMWRARGTNPGGRSAEFWCVVLLIGWVGTAAAFGYGMLRSALS